MWLTKSSISESIVRFFISMFAGGPRSESAGAIQFAGDAPGRVRPLYPCSAQGPPLPPFAEERGDAEDIW